MGRIKNSISYIKRHSMESDIWQIAIRPVDRIPLYQGNGKGFSLVKNSQRYWRADPFVFKYQGDNYLFAEMYDRKKKKGVIGVSKIKNGKCSRFRVCMETPWHMSYPCIFEYQGSIYMIPECSESKEISVYRSLRFPMKWKKVKVIQSIAAVDVTPVFEEKDCIKYLFCSLYDQDSGGNDNLYCIDNQNDLKPLRVHDFCCRSAGHIIYGERILRPSQNDAVGYGDSLIFNEVDRLDYEDYAEHECLRILPPDSLCSDNEKSISLLNKKKNLKYTGIHTYNANDDFEVIDLRIQSEYNIYTLWENRKRIVHKFLRSIKSKQ